MRSEDFAPQYSHSEPPRGRAEHGLSRRQHQTTEGVAIVLATPSTLLRPTPAYGITTIVETLMAGMLYDVVLLLTVRSAPRTGVAEAPLIT